MSKELEQVVEGIGNAFENLKKENEARLEALEKGRSATDFEQRIASLNATIDELKGKQDELEAKGNRPAFGGEAKDSDAAQAEYKTAFDKFLRKGDEAGLELAAKSLNISVDSEGGHTVPEELDRQIHDLVIDLSPMRQVANVVQTSSSDYKKLVNVRGTASGWVGEQAARPETAANSFEQIAIAPGELYTNTFVTQHMLDDAFFDVEGFVAREVAIERAKQEGQAFISGDGVNKPNGFLTTAQTDEVDGVRAFGTIQTVSTGAAGSFVAAPNGGDVLIDVVHSLKQGHRMGSAWLLNKQALAEVRKLKDGDGNYLWRPGLADGMPDTILGYRVVEMEDMPDIAADSTAIAFGNFQAGYTITDRVGVRMLRDPYSSKPFVQYYSTHRVGGKVIDSEAIKLVKFSV